MIDFQNANYFKLTPARDESFEKVLTPMLVEGEEVLGTFKTVRDGVVFTTKRLIAINVQGVTGKKKDFTSLPFRNVQAFSVETAGVLDMDTELELWFAGLGKVRFEFGAKVDIAKICRCIGEYALD